jgi:hypothetical protein
MREDDDHGPENTGIGIKKLQKCVFLRNFVLTARSSASMNSVAVEALALAARV